MPWEIAPGENLTKSISPKSPVVWIIRRTTCHSSGPKGCEGASLSIRSMDRASISSPLRGEAKNLWMKGSRFLFDSFLGKSIF